MVRIFFNARSSEAERNVETNGWISNLILLKRITKIEKDSFSQTMTTNSKVGNLITVTNDFWFSRITFVLWLILLPSIVIFYTSISAPPTPPSPTSVRLLF